jgi:hypothetical protein
VPGPKPFILKILVSKFFENKILRDTLWRNPRWSRLSELPEEKTYSGDLASKAESAHECD